VALVSTILPGASDTYIIPALEEASGRRLGPLLGYAYNPSFIALGAVAKGFEEPDYVIIGSRDEQTWKELEALHQPMVRNGAPFIRMTPVEAEITKIACNTHETMRVSFANMIFALCSELPGTDVDRITAALGNRLGHRFFKGAVPYGGPCWPRDNRAFAKFLDLVGVPSHLPQAVDLYNEAHGDFVLRQLLAATKRGTRVGILGLSYKPGTSVIEHSFAVELAQKLAEEGRAVIAWDPLAADEVRRVLGCSIDYAATAEDCLQKAEFTVILNPMQELAEVDWAAGKDTTVLDPWRCLPKPAVSLLGSYIPMGRSKPDDLAEWISSRLGERFHILNS
jgi:UDPglucose 6-dehydrogenase